MAEPSEYSSSIETPKETPNRTLKEGVSMGPIRAELLGTHVIVWNPIDGSTLYKEGFYGQPISIRKPKTFDFKCPVELSLLEALYLMEKQRIEVFDGKSKKQLSIQQLREYAMRIYDEFDDKYLVYRDLRKRGYIVRPGLKFGADFGVYQHGPGIDHAPFIVHALPKGTTINPIETVRAGRLATTVRKKFIIATITPSGVVNYLIFEWRKM